MEEETCDSLRVCGPSPIEKVHTVLLKGGQQNHWNGMWDRRRILHDHLGWSVSRVLCCLDGSRLGIAGEIASNENGMLIGNKTFIGIDGSALCREYRYGNQHAGFSRSPTNQE